MQKLFSTQRPYWQGAPHNDKASSKFSQCRNSFHFKGRTGKVLSPLVIRFHTSCDLASHDIEAERRGLVFSFLFTLLPDEKTRFTYPQALFSEELHCGTDTSLKGK